jgi:hypothetical protein
VDAYCTDWGEGRPALCTLDLAGADAASLLELWLGLLAAQIRRDCGAEAEELAAMLEALELGQPRQPSGGGGIIGIMPP